MVDEGFSITIKSWDAEYTINKQHSDLSLSEVVQEFKRLLLAAGFSKENIDEYIDDE